MLKGLMLGLAVMVLGGDPWVVYPGQGADKAGAGKKIVLVSGDEEYRSEEALPQLGRMLARHHGFQCVVLFAIDPKTGEINPNVNNNIPGLENLADADLMIIATRFRDLPPQQMAHIDAFLKLGKPVIGLRTATHAFNMGKDHPYARYGNGYNGPDKAWADGGFGRMVLGEKWISHHGDHGSQATRGRTAPGADEHPILIGIKDGAVFGPTDVYGVRLPLPGDSRPLLLGEVVAGMKAGDPPLAGKRNEPMMPVAWSKTYQAPGGTAKGRVFNTTMGASQDMENEAFRRLLVNATYWAVGLEGKITPAAEVEIVGKFKPTRFSFNGYTKGVKPADLAGWE
ncbi:MAG: ThuA domain-containing protein [Planctomycetota bacterium]|nr:ThuA domain-containing protein [Planctomycetota bacterium]